MNFSDVMKQESMKKFTENGAMAYDRLNGSLITLFAQIGALRPRTEKEIEDKFASAFNEDKLLATKMLFYCGNVRGGLGERRTFRICLKWLAKNYPRIVEKNIMLIPYYNRWDSLFELIDTPCEKTMWEFVSFCLERDFEQMGSGMPCSLLAKWLPTETASSTKTRELAKRAIKNIGMTPRQYRKIVSALRGHIRVTERKMSLKEWETIDYPTVPSYAMARYNQAFKRHDGERFSKYVEALNEGKAKVNASTLYPYDLVKNYLGYGVETNLLAEQQWKALPNYVEGENNIVIMADVSGSMSGRPMETSIGLAIYFAERATSDYHNLYMTFSREPHFIYIKEGATLREKVRQVQQTDIGYNTNLEKAFDYILNHALKNNVANEEMPKALVVISDLEIDNYIQTYGLDFVGEMEKKFASHSYTLPLLVLWNVEARNDTFLSQDEKVLYVSGQSPSTFKNVLGCLNGKTAYELMIETLTDKRYDYVII